MEIGNVNGVVNKSVYLVSMKKILLVGLAIAGLSVTTPNSRADGFNFSILLGHDHHYCAPPVVVAPPPVIVHPAPACEVVAPPVHVYGYGHGYRHDHYYTARERRHDWGQSHHGYRAHASGYEQGHSTHRSHGRTERVGYGRAH